MPRYSNRSHPSPSKAASVLTRAFLSSRWVTSLGHMTAPRHSSPTGTVSSWSAPSADRDIGPLRSTWRVKSPAASGRLTINRWTDRHLLAVVCLPVTPCVTLCSWFHPMTQIFFFSLQCTSPAQVLFGTADGQVIVMDCHGRMLAHVLLHESDGIVSMSWNCPDFLVEDSTESDTDSDENVLPLGKKTGHRFRSSFQPVERKSTNWELHLSFPVRRVKPLLTVTFLSGDISLMNNYDDLSPAVIRSGLKGKRPVCIWTGSAIPFCHMTQFLHLHRRCWGPVVLPGRLASCGRHGETGASRRGCLCLHQQECPGEVLQRSGRAHLHPGDAGTGRCQLNFERMMVFLFKSAMYKIKLHLVVRNHTENSCFLCGHLHQIGIKRLLWNCTDCLNLGSFRVIFQNTNWIRSLLW